MSKLFITLLFSAFAITTFAADTDKQTNGAELGTNETPQAQDQSQAQGQDQSRTSNKKSSNRHMKKHHSKRAGSNQNSGSSENNPLQPTESETAPGASH
jgi:Ni/Co efflux regulator RcnB